MTEVLIKPLTDNFLAPKRASDGSAAYDVFIQEPYKLKFGRQIIPAGFALSMPPTLLLDNRTRAGYAAFGLKAKDYYGNDVRLDADVTLGLIDSDYRDEVGTILIVRDEIVKERDFYLERGQAISQMLFQQVPETMLCMVTELDTTDRVGGFGKQNKEHISDDGK